jgi:phosphatidylglycerophosphatase A
MTRALIIFVASGACTGFAPFAPGTAGSLLGVLLAWATLSWAAVHWLPALASFAAAFVGGCWIAQRAQAIFGEPDSPHIVVDEVMGMIATMFFNPLDALHLWLGFVLFRLFDIVKLPPAGAIDRNLRGGLGVMLDDLAAAVYANIALRVLAHLIV